MPEIGRESRRCRVTGRGDGAKSGGGAGDQIVRLRIDIPKHTDAQMEEIAKRWRDHVNFDPREELRRKT